MGAAALHHVGLTVRNLDRSVQFYCELLQCRVMERSESSGAELAAITGLADVRLLTADLRLQDGGLLELIQYAHPVGPSLSQRSCDPGHTHVAFRVADVDEAYERLIRLQGIPRSPPMRLSAAGSSWDGATVFYALDPDGRTIELVQFP